MADDLVKQLTESIVIETYNDGTELCREPPELHKKAAARITELERQLEEAKRLKLAIDECRHDTWQCPRCGHSEPWWTESNAHYASEYPDSPRVLSGKGET
jgi:rubrerythrin